MRVATVGHVERIEFAKVEHVPEPGQIVHAERSWHEPGGGGAVAAVQLAKLAGSGLFFTALGDDEVGHLAHRELTTLGLEVEAAWRDGPQRRGFVFVDSAAERTITVLGDRLGPAGADALGWDRLEGVDAVYFTAGDAAAVRAARGARTMVAAARGLETLIEAEVELDVLVASSNDADERYERGQLQPEPRLVVRTDGAEGGEWERADGETGRYDATAPPGPPADAYGCGDSFAAGLTFGLGSGWPLDAALELAARCGAACLTGHGPYEAQLTAADL